MVFRLTKTTTTELASGRTVRGEGGMGRTRKDADVKYVDVKADGEGIDLPLIPPVDVYVDGVGDENDVRGGHDRPCASARFRRRTLKNKNSFPMG